eukprot:PhF_6_TR31404/c0_g1_i3/m.46018/K15424/PPP4R1; serine/threonine-protein phosphatase 4 regulatory subunit 1
MQESAQVSKYEGQAPDIEDDMKPLERMRRYHNDAAFPLQRIALAENIVDIASSLTLPVILSEMVPMLVVMSRDTDEAVRKMLVSQLGAFARHIECTGGSDSHTAILHDVLPILYLLVMDNNLDVRQVAIEQANNILRSVPEENRMDVLQQMVVWLKDSPEANEKEVGLELLLRTANYFGPCVCREHIVPSIAAIPQSNAISLRMLLARHLHEVMQVVGARYSTEALLPIYKLLCKDACTTVRKICAEMIVTTAQLITAEAREKELFDVYVALSKDLTKYVRIAAGTQLGKLLAVIGLGDPHAIPIDVYSIPHNTTVITQKMVQQYCALGASKNEIDLVIACAFSFVGVAATIGRDRWDELYPTFDLLASHSDARVCRPLVYALGDFSRIIGQARASTDLLPFAIRILSRNNDNVLHLGLVSTLVPFTRALPQTDQETFISHVSRFLVALTRQQYRVLLASLKPLGDLVSHLSQSLCLQDLLSVADVALHHEYVEVGLCATYLVGSLIGKVDLATGTDNNSSTTSLLNILDSLLSSSNYKHRIQYANIVQQSIEAGHTHFVDAYMIHNLVRLGCDAVVNVRIVVARILAATLCHHIHYRGKELTRTLKITLSGDIDIDVVHFATNRTQKIRHRDAANRYFR